MSQQMPTYGRAVFEQIYEACLMETFNGPSTFRIADDGFYSEAVGFEVLDWMPICDFDSPGSPDPLTAPLLPFPFTANQLAAVMLDSWGYFIKEACGEWANGPDEAMLKRFGVRAIKVKEVLREAYKAYRHAVSVVGEYPDVSQKQALDLAAKVDFQNDEENAKAGVFEPGISAEEYARRRSQAKLAVADLSQQHEQVAAQASAELENWRKCMVMELLGRSDATAQVNNASPTIFLDAGIKTVDVSDIPELSAKVLNPSGLTETLVAGLASPPAPKRRNRKPSWAVVAMPYMKALYADGKYKSAAVFYKALTQRAGETNSPFTLVNRELYCTAAGTSVSAGSLGNYWSEIRAR